MADSSEKTRLLHELRQGRSSARDELLTLVYDELRVIAARHMQTERRDHTLQPTALAHEAFLRLVDDSEFEWQDQAHFLAIASKVIRRVLIDYARQHNATKRGGALAKLRLSDSIVDPDGVDIDLVALDEALQELASLNPRHHEVVELRYFGGLTIRETAEVLGVSTKTVNTDWQVARAWLRLRLTDQRKM